MRNGTFGYYVLDISSNDNELIYGARSSDFYNVRYCVYARPHVIIRKTR